MGEKKIRGSEIKGGCSSSVFAVICAVWPARLSKHQTVKHLMSVSELVCSPSISHLAHTRWGFSTHYETASEVK